MLGRPDHRGQRGRGLRGRRQAGASRGCIRCRPALVTLLPLGRRRAGHRHPDRVAHRPPPASRSLRRSPWPTSSWPRRRPRGRPSRRPEIGAVVVGDDRAYVGLGTGVVALDRGRRAGWRRLPHAASRRSAPRWPPAADRLVTHDSAAGPVGGKTQVRIWLRDGHERRPEVAPDYAPTPFQPPNGSAGRAAARRARAAAGPGYDDAWDGGRGRDRRGPGRRPRRPGGAGVQPSATARRPLWVKSSQTPVTSMRLLGDLVVVGGRPDHAPTPSSPGSSAGSSTCRARGWRPPSDGRSVIIAVGGQAVAALGPGGGQLWRTPLPLELADAGVDQVDRDRSTRRTCTASRAATRATAATPTWSRSRWTERRLTHHRG